MEPPAEPPDPVPWRRPAPTSPSASPTMEAGHERKWQILAVLAAVAFMAQLDFFIVNVALDGIGQSFAHSSGHGPSSAALSWVLSAYAIVFATFLVPAGRFADSFGRRRTLLAGVAVFTAASVIAAVAPTLAVLIAARALQAFGAALIVPTSLGLLYPSFPKSQHTLVVGIWAGVAAIAASAGPPVGGLLVSLDWRWIFLINLPIGVATITAGRLVLPEVRQFAGQRLPEALSIVSLLVGVALLVLGTVQGPVWGWTDLRTLVVMMAALAGLLVTLQRTLHASAPVIERQLFKSRPFTAATIALFAYFTGFAIFLLGSALLMQNVWGWSTMRTGLGLAPAPVVSVGFALSAGPIQRRFGRVLPAVTGVLIMTTAAIWWLLTVNQASSYTTGLFPGLVLMGVSGGLSQAPMFAAAGSLPSERATTGSAVLNMTRQVGTAIGVALTVALTGTASASITGFDHAWLVQTGAGLLAAAALVTLHRDPATASTK